MQKSNLRWAANVFDVSGRVSFIISPTIYSKEDWRKGIQAKIIFRATSKSVGERFADLFGVRLLVWKATRQRRAQFGWSVGQRHAGEVASAMLPFSIEKYDVLSLVAEFAALINPGTAPVPEEILQARESVYLRHKEMRINRYLTQPPGGLASQEGCGGFAYNV